MSIIEKLSAVGKKRPNAGAIAADIRQQLTDTAAEIRRLEASHQSLALEQFQGQASEVAVANALQSLTEAKQRLVTLQAALRAAQVKAQEEEKAERLRAQKQTIARVTGLLRKREEPAERLSSAVTEAVRAFRELIEQSNLAFIAFPGGAPQGVHLRPGELLDLVAAELYRQGHMPFVGGNPGAMQSVNFPGGRCPDHKFAGLPDRLPSLSSRITEANEYAIGVLTERPSIDPTQTAA